MRLKRHQRRWLLPRYEATSPSFLVVCCDQAFPLLGACHLYQWARFCVWVWCLFPRSPQVGLDRQLRERWLNFAHLKHKPLDKKMSYLSPGEAFEILWHFTAEWLPSHIGHGVIWGSGAAVLLVSPDFVTDEKKDWPVLASLRRFRLVTRTRCSFVLVALFRSLLRASGGNTGSLFFGYEHRVPSLRASLQAVSEFVARNPLIASLALPLVYFSKKNSRSLFVWTLFAILESNAVMKAGYSKLSPANTGDSFTGKWTAFCWLMRSELNSVCFACKLTRWLGVAPLSNDGCGWLCDALKAGICFGTKDCMFGLSSLLIWSTSRSLNWSLISVFDIFAFDLILNLVTFVIILVITVN